MIFSLNTPGEITCFLKHGLSQSIFPLVYQKTPWKRKDAYKNPVILMSILAFSFFIILTGNISLLKWQGTPDFVLD